MKNKTKTAAKKQIMNARHIDFIGKLKQGMTSAEASRAVGISECYGRQLMMKEQFQVALKEGQKMLEQANNATAQRVILELARIAFAEPSTFYNENGTVKQPHEWNHEMRCAVSGIETFEEFQGRGEERELIGFTKKLKFYDKNAALKSLTGILGLDSAPKAPVGPDGKPLPQTQVTGYIVVPAKDIAEGNVDQAIRIKQAGNGK